MCPTVQRGTYSGLCAPPVIEHLKRLGITAVELMPVHQFIHDRRLVDLGLRNYWGYNSIAYLAPHNDYSSFGQRGGQVQEFKNLVKTLHSEGIEVILDVVYNHTGEGSERGPLLGYKGIDNPAYYRLRPDDPLRYVDYTGTGNSLNMRHPHVLQLIMDSLRYWVTDMHVDGFRFDLASTLARELHDVDKLSAFFDLIQQDPTISQVKLIAEPWDVGEGGYQVGNFPPLWSEWNGRYRDEVRDFWRGADNTMAEFAYRFTGSSDLYELTGRTPSASINFVTCHDGFTLADLVSYNDQAQRGQRRAQPRRRRRQPLVELRCRGPHDRRRGDRAAPAPAPQPAGHPLPLPGRAHAARRRRAGQQPGRQQQRLRAGQPHVVAGLEGAPTTSSTEFVRRLSRLRRRHPVFRRRRWFHGRTVVGETRDDIAWFTPAGHPMTDADWRVSFARSLGVFLNGEAIASPGPRGERVVDDSFLVLFNAYEGDLDFTLPATEYGDRWIRVIDTAPDDIDDAFPDAAPPGRCPPAPGRRRRRAHRRRAQRRAAAPGARIMTDRGPSGRRRQGSTGVGPRPRRGTGAGYGTSPRPRRRGLGEAP